MIYHLCTSWSQCVYIMNVMYIARLEDCMLRSDLTQSPLSFQLYYISIETTMSSFLSVLYARTHWDVMEYSVYNMYANI